MDCNECTSVHFPDVVSFSANHVQVRETIKRLQCSMRKLREC